MKRSSRKHPAIAVAVVNCVAFPLMAAQNKPPVANNDSYSVNANTPLSVPAPGVLANDTDQNGDPLAAAIVNSVSHGTLTLNATGSFTYTPTANFTGTDSFTYKANDGISDSGPATVSITVVPPPPNNPPVANNDSYSFRPNITSSVFAPGVLANDTDPDGDPLTAALDGPVSHGTLNFSANGFFTYKPDFNFTGTDSFRYVVRDGKTSSAAATVTITVAEGVNNPPLLGPLGVTADVLVNSTGSFTFVLRDPDGDLSLTIKVVQPPIHGTVSNFSPSLGGEYDGQYTPVPGFIGDDSFSIVANDGAADSNVLTIHVRVLPALSINNVSVTEGNSSLQPHAGLFTVTLSPPSTQTVTVNWATQDGTARATSDYVAGSGTLTFPPGTTSAVIRIPIIPDNLFEFDETFFVQLSSEVNARVTGGNLIGRGTCTILNDDVLIGVTEGIPPEAVVKVGERFTYGVRWTHPVRWRLLSTVDIRIIDDEDSVLNVRFDEAANTFSLFDPAKGKFLHPDAVGSRIHFETSAAVMYLENSQVLGSGPTGPSVLLNLNLSFKPKAAGRVFRVEAFATDDDGNEQGFDEAGAIAVLRK